MMPKRAASSLVNKIYSLNNGYLTEVDVLSQDLLTCGVFRTANTAPRAMIEGSESFKFKMGQEFCGCLQLVLYQEQRCCVYNPFQV